MPELRKDPVVGRWVIISPQRAQRPQPPVHRKSLANPDPCPFCVGHEAMTPPEILAYRPPSFEPDSPGWSIRVVPNKFPALVAAGEPERRSYGAYDLMEGWGVHEVIIETPDHETNMAKLSEARFAELLRAYRERVRELRRDARCRYILIFKNHGAEAGATLEHAHSQLIALPIVPREAAEELSGALRYFRDRKRCVYCDMVSQEIADGSRLVGENDHFVAFCPFAPRFPFETWILPKTHSACFEEASEPAFADLARSLREALVRLDRTLDDPPFNFIIHSNPSGEPDNDHYHWHVEIMPKLIPVAGFEWGSGCHINTVTPESAARSLRDISL